MDAANMHYIRVYTHTLLGAYNLRDNSVLQ